MRNDIARLHARTNLYQRRLIAAREIIRQAIMLQLPSYVSLSGGKDSTVVYALVREVAPGLPAVWSDDEWWLPETMEYIQRLQASGANVRQIRTNVQHTDWFTVSGDYNGIQDYAAQQGWQLVYLGLRQEESAARRVHLRTLGPLFCAKSDGVWHCNPLSTWTWQDTWAYILSEGIDYNRAYDRLEEIGVSPEHQRIGPLAVERVLQYGQMTILRRGWPELYNRFVARYPEAASYT